MGWKTDVTKYFANQAWSATKWYANVGNQVGRKYIDPAVRRMVSEVGHLGKRAMPAGMNFAALTVGASWYTANQTFDPAKHDSRITHIGKQIGADALDLGIASLMNPIAGIGYMAASMMGMPTISSAAMRGMDSISNKLDQARYGRRPVMQNAQTMKATQAQLSLLGQAGGYSMLGSEASAMHN